MTTKDPREVLARADRERRIERGAEAARASIRTFERPTLRRGVLGFASRREWVDYQFTQAETDAIYRALAIVRDEARSTAEWLESTVTLTEEDR